MLLTAAELEVLLPDFLLRQRWYGAADRTLSQLSVTRLESLRDEFPALAWALVEASFEDGSTATYQLLIGLRPLEQTERFLEGKGRSLLGDLDTPSGPALVYDALVDPDLAIEFLSIVAPGESATRMRPMSAEQSNTSVVYDERLILKLFRRVYDEPNPDVEVPAALSEVGFASVSAPVATWRDGSVDLAVVSPFLAGGTEGWQLAMTSLRDVYDSRLDPEDAGGDFGPEAARLGTITASMHVALAAAFGSSSGSGEAWADTMAAHLAHSQARALDAAAVEKVYDSLRSLTDAGASIRVHGDFHLGQTMRTDYGWFILDFEGEPALPIAERRLPSSPLRDVAGMLRSFHYASEVGLIERGIEAIDDSELRTLGARWESRAANAFCEGYFGTDGIDALLPRDEGARRVVLDAFVLAKAVYEVGYEMGHRPDWTRIPLDAIARVLG